MPGNAFVSVRHKQTCIYDDEHEVKVEMPQTLLSSEAVSKAEGSSSCKGKWTLLHLFPPLLFLLSTMSVGVWNFKNKNHKLCQFLISSTGPYLSVWNNLNIPMGKVVHSWAPWVGLNGLKRNTSPGEIVWKSEGVIQPEKILNAYQAQGPFQPRQPACVTWLQQMSLPIHTSVCT